MMLSRVHIYVISVPLMFILYYPLSFFSTKISSTTTIVKKYAYTSGVCKENNEKSVVSGHIKFEELVCVSENTFFLLVC